MNDTDNNKIKVNKHVIQIKRVESENCVENPIIQNTIIKRKLNNAIKSLNSEISNKIKDNIALDIFNNNANTLSSLLSKQNYNGAHTQENLSIKKEQKQTKTIETSGHQNYISYHLKDINNGGSEMANNDNDNIEKDLRINTNTIENSRNYKLYRIKNSFNSPYLSKKMIKNNGMRGKKQNDAPIKFIKDNFKNKSKKEFRSEINENFINRYSYKRYTDKILKKIKTEKILGEKRKEKEMENNIVFNEEVKIYKRKAVKVNNNKNGKSQDIKSNGKESKDKYLLLLENYRKRVAKQFLFYFKPYYYRFIKDYFLLFISYIKNRKHFKKILAPKKYIKKINKRNINININDNGKVIKDLRLVQLNYTNYTNSSYHDTENSNNQISSYNSKKLFTQKDQQKKMNYFLINSNNINFSTKETLKDKELYRNNRELEKKYIQILQRKRRKKNENNSNSQLNRDNKTIDISTLYSNNTLNNRNTILNSSYDKDYKIINTPHEERLMNSNNSISNGDISKEEEINITNTNHNIIKSIPRRQKEKDRKLKNQFNEKYESPGLSIEAPRSQKRYEKKYFFINSFIRPHKNNRTIKITRKEKINNINISRYNKNYISKKIKNISTIDKKINIHINYVFFIPPKEKDKINLEKINETLEISNNYSYTYIGTENVFKNKNIIYAKKKLTSIKEEEEKSRCSLSIIQNPKAIDE